MDLCFVRRCLVERCIVQLQLCENSLVRQHAMNLFSTKFAQQYNDGTFRLCAYLVQDLDVFSLHDHNITLSATDISLNCLAIILQVAACSHGATPMSGLYGECGRDPCSAL